MKRSRLLKRMIVGLMVAPFFLAAGYQLTKAGTRQQKQPSQQQPSQQQPSKYVGADTCSTCHDEVYKKFETTPHWKTMLDTRRGHEWQGCEACHGPGGEHVDGGGDVTKIFNFKNVSTKTVSETCMRCHQYTEEHSNFSRSAHKVNDVACLQCHSVHNARVRQFQLIKPQPELCYGCHIEMRPQFSRPFRHRVNERLLNCTDCHNQHGGFLIKGLRSTSAQDVVCFKCHVDKAGPFVFEHAPVKTEGCVACHSPHGSSNPRLLKRSQINLLCLECHTLSGGGVSPAGPSHDQSQKYQSCTLCHLAIHGSNLSPVFFK